MPLNPDQLTIWLTGAEEAKANGVEHIEVKTDNLIKLLKAALDCSIKEI